MSPKKYTSTAAMAPTWITAVNPTTAGSSTGIFISPSVIFRWPVDETGRNSVKPSTTPRIPASRMLIVVLTDYLSPSRREALPAHARLVQSLGRHAQRRTAALQILHGDRNGQRGDPRLGERPHLVGDPFLRPEQRRRIHEAEWHRGRRAGVVPGQV